MTTKNSASFKTIPNGTDHGTVTSVHKIGTNADNTMYSVTQHDHHPGEPAVVFHSGKALARVAK
jgi:hypothetical protein